MGGPTCLLILIYIRFCESFLLEGTTTKPSNGLSERHYTILLQQYSHVLNILVEERQLRQRLEESVTQMRTEFTNKFDHLISNETDMLKIELTKVENKYINLNQDFDHLKRDYTSIQKELAWSKNVTNQQENRLDVLSHLKIITQIQDTSNIMTTTNKILHQVQTNENDIRALNSKQQARNQDLIALHNQIRGVENTSQDDRKTCTDALVAMNATLLNIQENVYNTFVFLTAVANGHGAFNVPEQRINFEVITTSSGIPDIDRFKRDGTFTCHVGGLYLITVSISSNDKNGYFEIRKNNGMLSRGYTTNGNTGFSYTGVASAATNLLENDIITVNRANKGYYNIPKFHVYDQSSLSIVLIR